MTPERWQQIEELYHHALELGEMRQATFLDEACAGDAELRQEVESLVASHDQAGTFISDSALQVAARVLAEEQTSMVGQSLSHYRIESLLGVGGMGEVYQAQDTRLDRKVAVKILNARFSRDEANLTRFVQEAKAASALNHPNILVIHEVGTTGEANYIVSELIEGKTLRDRLADSPMKLREILDLSIQIATAVSAAHQAHLVHRDLKPENVMVRPDGYLKILDFGLAKLVAHRDASPFETGGVNQTASGMIVGTVNYMSPEQAKGEPVDERTDIFSLGVMIHEMVAGRTPFAGPSISETFANLINLEPQPLSGSDADVPDALDRIVAMMLRKDPAARYPAMKDVLADLKDLNDTLTFDQRLERSAPAEHRMKVSQTGDENRRAAQADHGGRDSGRAHPPLSRFVLAALLIAAIGVGYVLLGPGRTPARTDGRTSVAILPLTPLSTEGRDPLYEMGVADSLILKLSAMGFTVRPLSATRRYADVTQDPLVAGKEQNVDFVLASNYQLAHGRIRVTSQLFNTSTGQIEETYQSGEKDVADVFAMQDAIASEVGQVMSARFQPAARGGVAQRGTANEEAYRLYLQGMYLSEKRTPADARKAIELLEQAVRVDPSYARAWVGKAQAILTDFSDPEAQYWKSMEAARRALALDPNLADAHSVLCINKMAYEWDAAGAERECLRALELDPNSSLAHLNYSRYLNTRGRFDAAIAEVKTAIDLEPASLGAQRQLGSCFYYARRYPEAVAQFKRVIQMDERYSPAYRWLVTSLELQGNYPEAFQWWMKLKTLEHERPEVTQAYQLAYQTSGWPGVLLERAKRGEALRSENSRGGAHFHAAVEQARVGNKQAAFAYLEDSYRHRDYLMMYLDVDPRLDSLRQDPRFDDLRRRVGPR